MSKLETINGKTTNWCGLWWHPEYNGFSSESINLAQLKQFKGAVRLYVRKNKYFNGGQNGRPNYTFCLRDAQSETFKTLEIAPIPAKIECEEDQPYRDDEGAYYTENDERLYTREEVRHIINGAVYEAQRGFEAGGILPEDFI